MTDPNCMNKRESTDTVCRIYSSQKTSSSNQVPSAKYIQSMHSLLDTFFAQEIKTNNLDLTLFMETWLNDTPEDTAWLHQSDLI